MRTRACFTFIALFLAGCNNKTPEQQLLHDVQPAVSWIASLQLATESWLGNRVPTSFIRNAIDAADTSLEKAQAAADESKANDGLRNSVREQLRVARAAAVDVRAAIATEDRVRVLRARAVFASAYRVLNALQQGNS